MAEGHSNAAVAKRMGVAVSTAEKHVTAVFRTRGLRPAGTVAAGGDNARVRAVLTFLRHTGRLPAAPPAPLSGRTARPERPGRAVAGDWLGL
jgi:hypothetical protein